MSSDKDIGAPGDSIKSMLLESGGAAGSLYFMDALRLARMLERAALEDIQAKAKAMGANDEAVEKLKKDVGYLAKINPLESFRISKACTKASKYLSDSIVNTKATSGTKDRIPKLKPLYNREKYMQRFDAGFDNSEDINSNVPCVIVGSRKDLDAIISHFLDRCEVNENCCLHLSMKSFNKRLNKNYRKIRPEDWEGRVRARGGLSELMAEGSKNKPLEILIIDELSSGYGPSEKGYSALKRAHMCFNNASLSTKSRGVVLLAFQEADSDMKMKESEVVTCLINKSNYFECFSDDNGTYLKDRFANIVLTLPKV